MLQEHFAIAEIIALQRMRATEEIRYDRMLEAQELAPRGGTWRGVAASALVRFGMCLDRDAGERIVLTARGASR